MTAPPAAGDTGPGGLSLPAALFGAAVLLLALTAIGEGALLAREPWAAGAVCLDGGKTPPPPDALAVRARMVARQTPAPGDRELRLLHDWAVDADTVPQFRADTPELAVAVALPRGDLVPLLASGRLPEPGAPEALAGDLARDNSFELAGQSFTVVGRLRRNVSGFLFSYLILDDPALDNAFPDDGATVEGWAHPRGLEFLFGSAGDGLGDSGEGDAEEVDAAAAAGEGKAPSGEEYPAAQVPDWQGGETRTAPLVAWAGFAGLLLAALAGYIAHTRLCRRWAATLPGGHFFLPLFGEVAARPRLWIGMHAVLYALLFFAMLSMMSQPLLAHRFSAYIGAVFAEGGLEHVGRAYASGNVLEAAWLTWRNNFLEQTVVGTVLLSLFPLALGVVKNAVTFLLVGAGMAPVWVGRSGTYAFHVVTMILELEIYALASFCVTAWALRVLAFFRKPGPEAFRGLLTGVRVLGGTILFAGLVLAAAAFYEAVTLISSMP